MISFLKSLQIITEWVVVWLVFGWLIRVLFDFKEYLKQWSLKTKQDYFILMLMSFSFILVKACINLQDR